MSGKDEGKQFKKECTSAFFPSSPPFEFLIFYAYGILILDHICSKLMLLHSGGPHPSPIIHLHLLQQSQNLFYGT